MDTHSVSVNEQRQQRCYLLGLCATVADLGRKVLCIVVLDLAVAVRFPAIHGNIDKGGTFAQDAWHDTLQACG